MSVFLRAPAHNPSGPDGQGWNRLSIGALGVTDQCALRPRDYSHTIESQDTRRARWGGYGACVNRGQCDQCPVFTAAPRRLVAFGSRVLARIDQDGQPWLMNKPADGWSSFGYRWSWADLARVPGWRIGGRYRDEHSGGFWLERASEQ